MAEAQEQQGSQPDAYGAWPAALAQRLAVVDVAPVYAQMATCPVRHEGLTMVTTAGAIDTMVRSREVIGSGGIGPTGGAARPLVPLDIDGPEQVTYRKLLDPMFAPKRMALLEPSVRELADELIDQFIDRGEVELYNEFCAVLPGKIFMRLMGFPDADLDYFVQFKNDVLRSIPGESMDDRITRFFNAAVRCYDYLGAAIDQARATNDQSDGLMAQFCRAEIDGQLLSRERVQDIGYLLMIAGLDTVAASLSCIFSWFARHPKEQAWLVANPDKLAVAIEELLRYETPVPSASRTPMVDIEVAPGHVVSAGDHAAVLWAAANMDETVFANPTEVDLERAPNPHYTFAAGWHRCLGSHLARMELRAAIDQFHRRIPEYSIQPGVELVYESLPVRIANPLPLIWKVEA